MSLRQFVSLSLYTFIVAIITWYVVLQWHTIPNTINTEALSIPTAKSNLLSAAGESSEHVKAATLSDLAQTIDQSTPARKQDVSFVPAESRLTQDLQRLNRAHNQLLVTNDQLKERIAIYQKLLDDNEIVFAEPTPTQLDLDAVNAHLPDDFVGLTQYWDSDKKARFNTLLAEPKNDKWAFDMENQINDFIMLHEYGQNVRVTSVNCKQSMCEIYGYHSNNSLFQLLSQDLLTQPWFMPTNTQSNSSNAKNGDIKFYTLVSF